MRVSLINYTPKPIETVYTAARTCYSKKTASQIWAKRVTSFEMGKLLDRTIESGHHSILEHISFTFAIEGVSRAASHQLVRHRLASFSQQSQRYAELDDQGYITPNSIKYSTDAKMIFEEAMASCKQAYEKLRKKGIPKEDARFIMPNATSTNLVMTMNFRELWHVSGIRLCKRAQWEIRELFIKIKSELHSVPELTGFADYLGPRCETLGYCPEFQSCGLYPTRREALKNDKEY
ncbi:MAG: FAD-dependent thymidylate synthase [Candidatus Zixiibacteriota bacterium]